MRKLSDTPPLPLVLQKAETWSKKRRLDRWLDAAIEALIPDKPKGGGYYLPTPTPDYYNDDGVVYLKDLDPDDYIIWKEIDADK